MSDQLVSVRVDDRAVSATLTRLRRGVRPALRSIVGAGADLAKLRLIQASPDLSTDLVQVSDLSVRVTAKVQRLRPFRGRQTADGVVTDDGQRIPGAFVATMPDGRQGVFRRKRGTGGGARRRTIGAASGLVGRLPIEEIRPGPRFRLFGPTIPEEVFRTIEHDFGTFSDAELERLLANA